MGIKMFMKKTLCILMVFTLIPFYPEITKEYDNATYIVGDFTESLKQAYADVKYAYYSLGYGFYTHNDGSVVFHEDNLGYGLFTNNCYDMTYKWTSFGILNNGQNTGDYMYSLGLTSNGISIPNQHITQFEHAFANNSFTYNGAYIDMYLDFENYRQGTSNYIGSKHLNYINSVINYDY